MKTPIANSTALKRTLGTIALLCSFHFVALCDSLSYDAPGNLTNAVASGPTAPVISAQPSSFLLVTNQNVTFSVVASGTGISYQWLSNGIPIAGATNDSLAFYNSFNTNGTFSVVVSNALGAVTSVPAFIWADVNGNGIPDWWELLYFHNLNQPALGDYDGDGVSNIDEYREGTNPTNAASYNPRLHIQTVRGSVVATPDQPYYTMGQFITLTALPNPGDEFLGWSGGVIGTKSAISFAIVSNTTVSASFGLPLGVALNNTNLVWATGGGAPWFGQAEISQDGTGAAQSGLIVDGQQSTLQTTVNLSQSSILSFWWSASCQYPDNLTFLVDNAGKQYISGTAGNWQLFQTNLAPGSHTLLWSFVKNGGDATITGVPYADAVWLDEVSLTPGSLQNQSPGLGIALGDSNNVIVFWSSPATGFGLQQSALLTPLNWQSVTNSVSVIGGQNQVSLPLTGASQIFRLKSP